MRIVLYCFTSCDVAVLYLYVVSAPRILVVRADQRVCVEEFFLLMFWDVNCIQWDLDVVTGFRICSCCFSEVRFSVFVAQHDFDQQLLQSFFRL